MGDAGTRIAAAARSGVGFAAEAWRDAWAPLGLLAAGQAAAFIVTHLDIPNALAGRLELGAWIVSAVAFLPALGALYRSAVGGPALGEIGWGGLQLGRAEGRIFATLVLLAVAAAAAAAALLAVGIACWAPLRNFGLVRLPVAGPFGLWFLAASPLLLLVAWGALLGIARLSLLLPAVAGERRVRVGRALRASRRWSGSLAAAVLLLEIAPLLAVAAVAQALGWLERGQAGGFANAVWPTPDAVAAGVVLSLLSTFLLLPLGVGARTYFYGRVLAEERAADRRRLSAQAFAEAEPTPLSATETGDLDTALQHDEDHSVAAEATSPAASARAATVSPEAEQDEPVIVSLSAGAGASDPDAVAIPAPAAATARWAPPVASMRGAALAQVVSTPILLAHANDRDLRPSWWIPPEHPEGPPVA